jgi:protein tyrosine phosphatase (PTP) superfamily phosphohydrolase (DUF442 family)
MPLSDIVNYIAVDNEIGTAGQPTRAQFKAVRDAGYEVVVNLLPSVQDNALKGEDELIHDLGMAYRYIPVAWTDPKPADFAAFCDVMESVKGKRVFIHCAMNMRVTAFFSTYAMKRLGWTLDQADALIDQVWTANPDYQMPDVWRTFIHAIRRR